MVEDDADDSLKQEIELMSDDTDNGSANDSVTSKENSEEDHIELDEQRGSHMAQHGGSKGCTHGGRGYQ